MFLRDGVMVRFSVVGGGGEVSSWWLTSQGPEWLYSADEEGVVVHCGGVVMSLREE